MKSKDILYKFLLIIVLLLSIWFFTHYMRETIQIDNDSIYENFETYDASDAFCHKFKKSGVTLNSKCSKLTFDNCNKTNCCIYEKGNKCMAGNEDGPLFNSDEYGKTKDTIYYYKEKCYGC
jgi:hypothetical protein